MASYYPSFTYMGINSLKDKKLMVVAFDPDNGEMDTFLGMDCIYIDKYDGSRRLDYGAKFNSTAVIKISVVKTNKKDFTVAEVRDFLKWTTGIRKNSYLDLLIGDKVKYSFLGRVTNAYQQKLDARTIGLSIEFTSVSPWAYSPIQYVGYSPDQAIAIDNDGVLYKDGGVSPFSIDANGVLSNTSFSITDDGVAYINNSPTIEIDNKTDDLYTPVYLNTTFRNNTSDTLSIKNLTLGEETIITGLSANEVITLSENQFILSDKSTKIFGNDFNFVWPKLGPGINELTIDANGNGSIEFTYRYPIKIGDCAIDINELDDICGDYSDDDIPESGGTTGGSESGTISSNVYWNNIIGKPTTLSGYGVKNEVSDMINKAISNYVTNYIYTKNETYTKEEVDALIAAIKTTISEEELKKILSEILGAESEDDNTAILGTAVLSRLILGRRE